MKTARVILPLTALLLGLAVLIWPLVQSDNTGGVNLGQFGTIPVMHEGRIKPLDSAARDSLLVISGRRTVSVDGESRPAIRWLLDVITDREPTPRSGAGAGAGAGGGGGSGAQSGGGGGYRVFRIDHPQLLALLNLPSDRTRFAYSEFSGRLDQIETQANLVDPVPPRQRDAFQRSIMTLVQQISTYENLRHLESILPLPPQHTGETWDSLPHAVAQAGVVQTSSPPIDLLGGALLAYHRGDVPTFNARVDQYHTFLTAQIPHAQARGRLEAALNRSNLLVTCTVLYVAVFLLACFSWIVWGPPLRWAAITLMALTLAAHTLGLALRMYLQGRPPVTDLYSSAIFIGWGAVVLALIVELLHRRAIGLAAGSLMGTLSLLVAINLADGESLKTMQAVLDSNFWLATHVIAVTIGYLATFLAGIIAIFYILAGVFTPALVPTIDRVFERIVYGVVCFALLFSFVGTVLGGIWADQSWGRFWGWDPKENGAVLIVLWNALILHARFGGMVRRRGTMVLAVFGNVVTSWSWFGTNMLGVGLHSYGFMGSAMQWLGVFVVSQATIIMLGLLPLQYWKSFEKPPVVANPSPALV